MFEAHGKGYRKSSRHGLKVYVKYRDVITFYLLPAFILCNGINQEKNQPELAENISLIFGIINGSKGWYRMKKPLSHRLSLQFPMMTTPSVPIPKSRGHIFK